MNTLQQGISHDDCTVTGILRAKPYALDDGRLPSFIWAHVTSIDDPEKQGRIKCTWYFQQEQDVAEQETDWITRLVPASGPTNMKRKHRFGVDWPHPEVHQRVVLACMGGDPYDLIFVGVPQYMQGDHGSPPLEKDDHKDWAIRIETQSGFLLGVDTEGNVTLVVPGNLRIKVLGAGFASARTIFTIWAPTTRLIARAMNRLIGGKVETANYKTPEEELELTAMEIDAMTSPPGYKDPGIGKVEDLED